MNLICISTFWRALLSVLFVYVDLAAYLASLFGCCSCLLLFVAFVTHTESTVQHWPASGARVAPRSLVRVVRRRVESRSNHKCASLTHVAAACTLFAAHRETASPFVTLRFVVTNATTGTEEAHSVELTVAEFQVCVLFLSFCRFFFDFLIFLLFLILKQSFH